MFARRALLFTLFLGHFGCFDAVRDENQIKIKNELSSSLRIVRIGELTYHNIDAGSTSEPQSLDGGSYQLTATTEDGTQYSQDVLFLGRFLKFVVIFKADGTIEVRRE